MKVMKVMKVMDGQIAPMRVRDPLTSITFITSITRGHE
jgi:hypothetical protein